MPDGPSASRLREPCLMFRATRHAGLCADGLRHNWPRRTSSLPAGRTSSRTSSFATRPHWRRRRCPRFRRRRPSPATRRRTPREPWKMSLNEAVRITLENAKAIRVFTGLGAANSGSSIYDPSIANTVIDQQQARFDTTFAAGANAHPHRNARPGIEPQCRTDRLRDRIDAASTTIARPPGLTRSTRCGGRSSLNLVNDFTAFNRGGLEPESGADARTGVELHAAVASGRRVPIQHVAHRHCPARHRAIVFPIQGRDARTRPRHDRGVLEPRAGPTASCGRRRFRWKKRTRRLSARMLAAPPGLPTFATSLKPR